LWIKIKSKIKSGSPATAGKHRAVPQPRESTAQSRNCGKAPAPVYAVITPVRNEADHIQKTIDSMVAQTITPGSWVIVDDGSTDQTAAIIDAAAARYPWIKVLHRPDRGFRKSGGGVIEAFDEGLALLSETPASPGPPVLNHSTLNPQPSTTLEPSTLNSQPSTPSEAPNHRAVPQPQESTAQSRNRGKTPAWSFLVKLDGDLEFASDYFKRCFEEFQQNHKLGIGGGVVCKLENGEWVEEAKGDPPFHVRGATKIYRAECWEAIGGLIAAPGWDTLDELKANMLGWATETFREIKLLQLKSTGTADGTWKNWVKNGRANYVTGYHPVFMLAKCVKRSIQKPYAIAALGLLSGFVWSYFRRLPQVPDSALIRYVRTQQTNRLLGKQSLWP
jgi:poly-beta-1,6-N-acetyl-D-glucosamine synthase